MKVEEILKRDNNNIDLIRLVVAVMVLWSHSFPLTFGNGSGEWLGRFLKITYSGQLGVNIFFFISGLLVANSLIKKGSPAKFIISRFFRLMPALFFLLIITVFCVGPIVTTLPIGEYFRNVGTWNYFISNLFLKITYPLPGCFENNVWPVDVNGSLWTLPLEVTCYIFLLGVFILSKGNRKTITIISVSIIALSVVPRDYILMLFGREWMPGMVQYGCFAFGAILACNQEKIEINTKLIVGLLLLCIVFWRYKYFIGIIFPITISVVLLYLSTSSAVLKCRMKYDISYGVYIWHFLIQQVLYLYLGQINVYLFFVLSLLLTVIVSLVSYILIEKKAIDFGYELGNKVVKSSFNYERVIVYAFFVIVAIAYAKIH